MATHLIIPSSFRLQIKEDTLWNDVGALCKCGAITIGNNVIGCGCMEDTGYDTSPIVSNESLRDTNSEKNESGRCCHLLTQCLASW